MELVWGTKDFMIAGQPYQGFPILLWDSMESCSQANQFFRYYLLRGDIGSKESWPSTGRALYDYFSFLQAHDLDWRDVDRGEAKSLVAAYRDYCLVTCELARNTTRQRLTYICEFYEFALDKGWVRRLPFGHEERTVPRDTSLLEHVDASGGKALANDVMPRRHKPLPKFLSMSQTKSLLTKAENPHHRIMIQLALRTGLRRNELATFPVAYVFDPDKAGGTERNLRIRLDPVDGSGMETKGSKERDIWMSRKLMAELYRYVTKLRGERASLGKSQKALLLNHFGEPYGSSGKSLNRIIVKTGKRVGIEVHSHMLRHTYPSPQEGTDPTTAAESRGQAHHPYP